MKSITGKLDQTQRTGQNSEGGVRTERRGWGGQSGQRPGAQVSVAREHVSVAGGIGLRGWGTQVSESGGHRSQWPGRDTGLSGQGHTRSPDWGAGPWGRGTTRRGEDTRGGGKSQECPAHSLTARPVFTLTAGQEHRLQITGKPGRPASTGME